MKSAVLVAAVAIALGATLGVGRGYWHFGVIQSYTPDYDGGLDYSDPPSDGPQPKAVVDNAEYRFGKMELGSSRRHIFQFRNEGEYPLVLTKGETTCKCTVADVSSDPIAPGQSTDVVLEWHGEMPPGATGSEFRQSAIIHTNDRQRRTIELTVVGELTSAVTVDPRRDLVFTRVPRGGTASGQVRLFAYRSTPLEIVGQRMDNAALAPLVEVDIQRLPEAEATIAGAASGLALTITLKPGLPRGAFRQTIHLETNFDTEPIEITVAGDAVDDVHLVGAQRSGDDYVLSLGKVRGEVGAKRQVTVWAHGTNRDAVQPRVVEKRPVDLAVAVGSPDRTQEGVTRWPLSIEIPPGTGAMDYRGPDAARRGLIVIETGHPEAPRLRLSIDFVVEP